MTADAELLFESFSQRYERGSTPVTSNLPFDEWTERWGWIAASRRGFDSWKRELTGLGRVPFRGGVDDEEGLLPAHLGGRPARIRRQITASACLVGHSVRFEVPGMLSGAGRLPRDNSHPHG
jgi:hypothetical protein